MHRSAARILLAGAVLAGILGSQAQAQFQVAPGLNQNSNNAGAAGTGPYANQPNRSGGNFFNPANLPGGQVGRMVSDQAGPPSAYGGQGGYPGIYPPFPFFGYGTYIPGNMGNLYGSATVINSLGDYMEKTQHTYLMQEQVKREKLDTRRRVLEQWLWERNNLPTTQDEFERAQKLQLRRSQNDPPTNEIFAGRSLNDLLVDAQRLQSRGLKGQDIPLDKFDFTQINFSPRGKGAANAGILKDFKDTNKLTWPTELRGEDYEKAREAVNKLTRDAIQQVSTSGQVDIGTLNEMDRLVKQMTEELRVNLNRKDLPPASYNPAKSFLAELSNSVKALGEPDAKKYFDGHYSAAGKTMSELVQDMQNKGLEFGPATPTQRPAYVAMHRALASYDLSLNSNAGFTAEQSRP